MRQSKYGGGANDIRSIAAKATGNASPIIFPGEKHAIGLSGSDIGRTYNYMGPGTKIDLREQKGPPANTPINRLDEAAKKHDFAFQKLARDYKARQDKTKLKNDIRKADAQFKRDVEANKSIDPALSKIAQVAISAKEIAETSGLIDRSVFSNKEGGKFGGAIIDKQDGGYSVEMEKKRLEKMFIKPADQLTKLVINDTKIGGLAPFLVPIAIAVVSAVAKKGLDVLLDVISNKIKKKVGGAVGMTDQDKREIILKEMSKLPKSDQIEILSHV